MGDQQRKRYTPEEKVAILKEARIRRAPSRQSADGVLHSKQSEAGGVPRGS